MRKWVKTRDLPIGDGEVAERGSLVAIRYEGYLRRGERFGGDMVRIDLGRRETIAGQRYGIEGMRVGGRRRMIVGPHLAYGAAGVPGVIPPDAVLTFKVELLEVRRAGQTSQ